MAINLKSDSQGFLIGDSVNLDELKNQWALLKRDTEAIRKAVNAIVRELKDGNKTTDKTPNVQRVSTERVKTDNVALPRVSRESRTPIINRQRESTPRTRQNTATNKVARERTNEPKTATPEIKVTVNPPTVTVENVTKQPRERVSNRGKTRQRITTPTLSNTPIATPRIRETREVKTSETITERSREVSKESKTTEAVKELTKTIKQPVTPARDNRGRFVARGKTASEDTEDKQASAIRGLTDTVDRVGSTVSNISEGMQETDPMVQAMGEVAAPLKTGWDLVSGSASNEEGWLRRIFRNLTQWRKEDSTYNKAIKKELKEIKEKPAGVSGDKPSFISNPIKWLQTGGLGGLFALIGKFTKKIPVIGGVLSGLGSLFDIFDSELSSDTRENKDRRTGRAIGKFGGTLLGGFGGAKLGALIGSIFGPVGTAIGAGIGSLAGMFFGSDAGKIVGEKVGEFTTWLRDLDIAGKIQTAWETVTTSISTVWDNVTNTFSQKWNETIDSVKTSWDSLTNSLQSIWESVTGSFSQKWDVLTDNFKSIWETTTGEFTKIWDSLKGTFEAKYNKFIDSIQKSWNDFITPITDFFNRALNAVNDFIKNWTGIDVKATVGKVTEKVTTVVESTKEKVSTVVNGAKEKVTELKNTVTDKVNTVKENTTNFVKNGWNTLKNGVSSIFGGGETKPTEAKTQLVSGGGGVPKNTATGGSTLGWVSRKFESARGGAGTISSGKGDYGGASYGSHQLSSKAGTLQRFLKTSGYGKEFEGLTPGTPEFNAKWKQIARTDGENFEAAQEKFIKETHYDPALAELQNKGIDLTNRGQAVQEALFSTATQFGPTGAKNLFKNALKGKDVSTLSDSDIISAVQDYKIANNERLFSQSDSAHKRGTLNRAIREKKFLLTLANHPVNEVDTELVDNNLASELKPSESTQSIEVMPQLAAVTASSPTPIPTAQKAVQIATGTNTAIAASTPVAAPKQTAIPAIPQTEKTPAVETPLGTGNRANNSVTVNIEGDARQDVSDRLIAHIATGGYAAYGIGGD